MSLQISPIKNFFKDKVFYEEASFVKLYSIKEEIRSVYKSIHQLKNCSLSMNARSQKLCKNCQNLTFYTINVFTTEQLSNFAKQANYFKYLKLLQCIDFWIHPSSYQEKGLISLLNKIKNCQKLEQLMFGDYSFNNSSNYILNTLKGQQFLIVNQWQPPFGGGQQEELLPKQLFKKNNIQVLTLKWSQNHSKTEFHEVLSYLNTSMALQLRELSINKLFTDNIQEQGFCLFDMMETIAKCKNLKKFKCKNLNHQEVQIENSRVEKLQNELSQLNKLTHLSINIVTRTSQTLRILSLFNFLENLEYLWYDFQISHNLINILNQSLEILIDNSSKTLKSLNFMLNVNSRYSLGGSHNEIDYQEQKAVEKFQLSNLNTSQNLQNIFLCINSNGVVAKNISKMLDNIQQNQLRSIQLLNLSFDFCGYYDIFTALQKQQKLQRVKIIKCSNLSLIQEISFESQELLSKLILQNEATITDIALNVNLQINEILKSIIPLRNLRLLQIKSFTQNNRASMNLVNRLLRSLPVLEVINLNFSIGSGCLDEVKVFINLVSSNYKEKSFCFQFSFYYYKEIEIENIDPEIAEINRQSFFRISRMKKSFNFYGYKNILDSLY